MFLLVMLWPASVQARVIPKRCENAVAQRLCAIHTYHREADSYRSQLGLAPLPYRWLAERYPARRDRILRYWHHTERHAAGRWHRYVASPWPAGWLSAALCVHHYEGAWNAYNPAGPYYGGMQMDASFESTYGPEFVRAYGDARAWPPHDQLIASYRAWQSRGWSPWPVTAARCGLL